MNFKLHLLLVLTVISSPAIAASAAPAFNLGELVCEIGKGIPQSTWIEDLNRIQKQIKQLPGDDKDPTSQEAEKAFDLRIPFLSRIMYWFFSTKEFSYPMAYHNPQKTTNYDLNIFAVLMLEQLDPNIRPATPLITEVGLLQRLKQKAASEKLFLTSVPLDKLDAEGRLSITYFMMASHLTDWLLQQEKGSLSQIDLYRKAFELAGDGYGALGLISFVFFIDANALPRKKNAVLSSKLKSISELGAEDHAGSLYHFWNYLARSVAQPQDRTHLYLMSLAYERINQGDLVDYEADMLGLKAGRLVERVMRDAKICNPKPTPAR